MRLVLAAVVVPVFGSIVPALRNLVRGCVFALRLRSGPWSRASDLGCRFLCGQGQLRLPGLRAPLCWGFDAMKGLWLVGWSRQAIQLIAMFELNSTTCTPLVVVGVACVLYVIGGIGLPLIGSLLEVHHIVLTWSYLGGVLFSAA